MCSVRTSVLLLCISIAAVGCGLIPNSGREAGNDLVARVEQYRVESGELPLDARALGIDARIEGPVYYRRVNGSRYEMWYGTDLGESVTYESEVGRWE